MQWFFTAVKNEPAVFGEMIRSGILLAIVFGVAITEQQLAAIMVFLGIVITFFTRAASTPNTKVDTHVTVTRTSAPEGGGTTTKTTVN